jgi:hypothetical protein
MILDLDEQIMRIREEADETRWLVEADSIAQLLNLRVAMNALDNTQ